VGTGFHPELTGRENVFLNGSILGMRRSEIQRRFDEIVEFAGTEKFLDTPVKRYSSGMQVRLAFAVAAHLQPEILLIDEVLAVGDAEFQKKCLGKMEDVTKDGRTVVFVSHNMALVRSLCPRSLVLEQGTLVFDGPTDDALHHYLDHASAGDAWLEGDRLQRFRTPGKLYASEPVIACDAIGLLDEEGIPRTSFRSDESVTIAVDYECLQDVNGVTAIVDVFDRAGSKVLRSESMDGPEGAQPLKRGRYRSTCVLPAALFGSTRLRVAVRLSVALLQTIDYADALEFDVAFQGLGGNPNGADATFRPMLTWRTAERDALVAAGHSRFA
jgi:lipopolysaccharide transport system ATP-binding protein